MLGHMKVHGSIFTRLDHNSQQLFRTVFWTADQRKSTVKSVWFQWCIPTPSGGIPTLYSAYFKIRTAHFSAMSALNALQNTHLLTLLTDAKFGSRPILHIHCVQLPNVRTCQIIHASNCVLGTRCSMITTKLRHMKAHCKCGIYNRLRCANEVTWTLPATGLRGTGLLTIFFEADIRWLMFCYCLCSYTSKTKHTTFTHIHVQQKNIMSAHIPIKT
jgi:hypothetical protein